MKRALNLVVVNFATLLLVVLTVIPLWWMVVASFTPTGQALSDSTQLIPSTVTLEHYKALFSRLHLARFFGNSVLLASSITALALLTNGMAGYAFAKLRFRGRDTILWCLLLTLLIPAQVAMLPLFLMLREFNLINSYWAVILPAAASVYGIFLVRQYALSIPDSLLDAARIDGASEVRIYFQIVVPVIRPILVALGIFTFLTAWNDFMWPLIVLTDSRKFTLPVALAILSGEHVQDVELMMAGAVITVVPVLLLFLLFQRQLIGGIAAGSVKG